jgi:hypothetical protein
MKENKMTLEKIAELMNDGFAYMEQEFQGFRAFQIDMLGFKDEMLGFRKDTLEFQRSTLDFQKESEGALYKLLDHANVTNDRLGNIGGRLENVENDLKVIKFEIKNHDQRLGFLETAKS